MPKRKLKSDSNPKGKPPAPIGSDGVPVVKRGRGRPRKYPAEPPRPKKQQYRQETESEISSSSDSDGSEEDYMPQSSRCKKGKTVKNMEVDLEVDVASDDEMDLIADMDSEDEENSEDPKSSEIPKSAGAQIGIGSKNPVNLKIDEMFNRRRYWCPDRRQDFLIVHGLTPRQLTWRLIGRRNHEKKEMIKRKQVKNANEYFVMFQKTQDSYRTLRDHENLPWQVEIKNALVSKEKTEWKEEEIEKIAKEHDLEPLQVAAYIVHQKNGAPRIRKMRDVPHDTLLAAREYYNTYKEWKKEEGEEFLRQNEQVTQRWFKKYLTTWKHKEKRRERVLEEDLDANGNEDGKRLGTERRKRGNLSAECDKAVWRTIGIICIKQKYWNRERRYDFILVTEVHTEVLSERLFMVRSSERESTGLSLEAYKEKYSEPDAYVTFRDHQDLPWQVEIKGKLDSGEKTEWSEEESNRIAEDNELELLQVQAYIVYQKKGAPPMADFRTTMPEHVREAVQEIYKTKKLWSQEEKEEFCELHQEANVQWLVNYMKHLKTRDRKRAAMKGPEEEKEGEEANIFEKKKRKPPMRQEVRDAVREIYETKKTWSLLEKKKFCEEHPEATTDWLKSYLGCLKWMEEHCEARAEMHREQDEEEENDNENGSDDAEEQVQSMKNKSSKQRNGRQLASMKGIVPKNVLLEVRQIFATKKTWTSAERAAFCKKHPKANDKWLLGYIRGLRVSLRNKERKPKNLAKKSQKPRKNPSPPSCSNENKKAEDDVVQRLVAEVVREVREARVNAVKEDVVQRIIEEVVREVREAQGKTVNDIEPNVPVVRNQPSSSNYPDIQQEERERVVQSQPSSSSCSSVVNHIKTDAPVLQAASQQHVEAEEQEMEVCDGIEVEIPIVPRRKDNENTAITEDPMEMEQEEEEETVNVNEPVTPEVQNQQSLSEDSREEEEDDNGEVAEDVVANIPEEVIRTIHWKGKTYKCSDILDKKRRLPESLQFEDKEKHAILEKAYSHHKIHDATLVHNASIVTGMSATEITDWFRRRREYDFGEEICSVERNEKIFQSWLTFGYELDEEEDLLQLIAKWAKVPIHEAKKEVVWLTKKVPQVALGTTSVPLRDFLEHIDVFFFIKYPECLEEKSPEVRHSLEQTFINWYFHNAVDFDDTIMAKTGMNKRGVQEWLEARLKCGQERKKAEAGFDKNPRIQLIKLWSCFREIGGERFLQMVAKWAGCHQQDIVKFYKEREQVVENAASVEGVREQKDQGEQIRHEHRNHNYAGQKKSLRQLLREDHKLFRNPGSAVH